MAKASPAQELNLDVARGAATAQIKGILAAADFSAQSRRALRIAARLAKHLHSKLYMLHVDSPQINASGIGTLTPVLQDIYIVRTRKQLHTYAAQIPELRTVKHEELVLCGSIVEAIIDTVEAKRIDLVVMGAHGRGGLGKMALGSVAESAISHLHCPVLIIGPHCDSRRVVLKQVLFATDIPVSSLRATQCAVSIARESGAALTVVHVLPQEIEEMGESGVSIRKRATDVLSRLVPRQSNPETHIDLELVTGHPHEEILRVAKRAKAGLIVMGAKERSSLTDHAPWTTLSQVIRGANCPVLVVKPAFS